MIELKTKRWENETLVTTKEEFPPDKHVMCGNDTSKGKITIRQIKNLAPGDKFSYGDVSREVISTGVRV